MGDVVGAATEERRSTVRQGVRLFADRSRGARGSGRRAGAWLAFKEREARAAGPPAFHERLQPRQAGEEREARHDRLPVRRSGPAADSVRSGAPGSYVRSGASVYGGEPTSSVATNADRLWRRSTPMPTTFSLGLVSRKDTERAKGMRRLRTGMLDRFVDNPVAPGRCVELE